MGEALMQLIAVLWTLAQEPAVWRIGAVVAGAIAALLTLAARNK